MSPLDTPLTFRWPRLPAVARLKSGGPQGRLVLQGSTLDGSGAFRSDGVSTLHRIAAYCYARRITQSKFRVLQRPKTCPTHGSVPPSPPFRRATEGSRVLRKVWGVKRGKKTLVVFPLLPPAVGTAFPRPPKAAIAHAHFERKVASTGCAAVSAEGLPSAEEKEKRAASPGRGLTPAFLCHKKFTPLRVENPRRS